jgi:hypothetical protein
MGTSYAKEKLGEGMVVEFKPMDEDKKHVILIYSENKLPSTKLIKIDLSKFQFHQDVEQISVYVIHYIESLVIIGRIPKSRKGTIQMRINTVDGGVSNLSVQMTR